MDDEITVIENKDFVSKIEIEQIKIIKYDYELKLEDLKNVKIEYIDYKVNVNFDNIYVNDFEKLIKINFIIGSFKNYHLNEYYIHEQDNMNTKVTLSNELIKYLYEWEINYLKSKLGDDK